MCLLSTYRRSYKIEDPILIFMFKYLTCGIIVLGYIFSMVLIKYKYIGCFVMQYELFFSIYIIDNGRESLFSIFIWFVLPWYGVEECQMGWLEASSLWTQVIWWHLVEVQGLWSPNGTANVNCKGSLSSNVFMNDGVSISMIDFSYLVHREIGNSAKAVKSNTATCIYRKKLKMGLGHVVRPEA